jgi:hypothetical protein
VIVTVLNEMPEAVASTVSESTSVSPGWITGTAQSPPPAAGVNVVPAAGFADTKVTLAGSVSATVTLVAAAVPRLNNCTV